MKKFIIILTILCLVISKLVAQKIVRDSILQNGNMRVVVTSSESLGKGIITEWVAYVKKDKTYFTIQLGFRASEDLNISTGSMLHLTFSNGSTLKSQNSLDYNNLFKKKEIAFIYAFVPGKGLDACLDYDVKKVSIELTNKKISFDIEHPYRQVIRNGLKVLLAQL